MSKAVMLSVQPKWCELIASGKKTIEVRKTRPSIKTPFKCYIYCTKSNQMLWVTDEQHRYIGIACLTNAKAVGGANKANGKVIGEFVCDRIEKIEPCFEYYSDGYDLDDDILTDTCLTCEELMQYGKGAPLYGWHISDLVIYDKPKELREFYKVGKHAACAKGERTCDRLRYTDFCRTCKFEIRRPPQSWQYIEA